MTRSKVPILLLAGGSSSRMRGGDKLLEPVDGEPLLRVMARRALEVSSDVYVALRPDRPERVEALADLPVELVLTQAALEGMSGTLREGVAALPPCDAFMVLLADIPAIGAAEMQAVLTAYHRKPTARIWRGATASGQPGHPILFHGCLRPLFDTLKGDRGGEDIVKPLRDRTELIRFADDRARADLDTPEDWVSWRLATHS